MVWRYVTGSGWCSDFMPISSKIEEEAVVHRQYDGFWTSF